MQFCNRAFKVPQWKQIPQGQGYYNLLRGIYFILLKTAFLDGRPAGPASSDGPAIQCFSLASLRFLIFRGRYHGKTLCSLFLCVFPCTFLAFPKCSSGFSYVSEGFSSFSQGFWHFWADSVRSIAQTICQPRTHRQEHTRTVSGTLVCYMCNSFLLAFFAFCSFPVPFKPLVSYLGDLMAVAWLHAPRQFNKKLVYKFWPESGFS